MIEIPLTPEEFAAKRLLLEQKEGIRLSGPEGLVEKSGIKAAYRYADGLLTVNVLEKPFFVSTEYCETEMRRFLGK